MKNTRLDELQAGIKIAGRNIITSDMQMIPLVEESEDKLKSLLIRVKEENEKASLKLKIILKSKIVASSPITSW